MMAAPPKARTRWGDEADDSDDDNDQQPLSVSSRPVGLGGGKSTVIIPPTHKSRVDASGVMIVTSYREQQPGSNSGALIKTVQKVQVSKVTRRIPKAVEERKQSWTKFGQAKLDAAAGVQTTVQSKEDIMVEDPHADTDLQDEDPAAAIAGNLNAFWVKQQRRQLERKYDVGPSDENDDGGGAWTQVGSGAAAAGAGGGSGNTGKYVPPSARLAAAGAGTGPGGDAGGAGGPGTGFGAGGGFKSDRSSRMDDLNTIRVTNLSENTTEMDLQELFSSFGRISRVYLAKDKETMLSRGFAFVSFVQQADAQRAMDALQGFGYDHLILKLEWARPNAPKDPATSGTQFRSGYGKALAQDTKEKVSFASNLTN